MQLCSVEHKLNTSLTFLLSKLDSPVIKTLHRGAFCQLLFRWIYCYDSNKSTGKNAGKTHLCALDRIRFTSNQNIGEGGSNFDGKNVEEVFNFCSTKLLVTKLVL